MRRIKLLGPPLIEIDGRPIDLSSVKGLALLCYVAASAGRPVPRAQLVALLWEDYPEDAARHSLSSLLTRLRAVLPCWPLRASGDALEWNGSLEVDACQFDALVAAGDFDGAAALWRGPFLDGLALADSDACEGWLRQSRQAWDARFVDLAARLAAAAQTRGDWDAVLAHARRGLAADPLQERLHRAAMSALHALGDRAAALAQYERCRGLLAAELGAEPDAATLALRDTIAAAATAAAPNAVPGNLPRQLTNFVGRARELAEVRRLVETTRLLTLTGTGGVGKTRLALEAASALAPRHPDGAWLADLAALSDPALVARTVATAFGLREAPGRAAAELLAEHLRDRSVLLVLDNCEHLVDACARLVDALLRAAPALRVLATSREPLGVQGEVVWRVPSLSLPDPARSMGAAEVLAAEAPRLFAVRAAAAAPGFGVTDASASAVAEICRRLDGIPLAIELAAARVGALGLAQIAARLDDRFRLLTTGSRSALPRQHTLRATLNWSHDLLPPEERALFRRLSVFAGGWSLEAAELVCPAAPVDRRDVAALLARLVDRSLVVAEPGDDGPRYRFLETVGAYARELLLGAGEEDDVRARHASYVVALVEQAEPALSGADQAIWLDRLEREAGNLRAALRWATADPTSPGRVETGLRLGGALWQYWYARGHLAEGLDWLASLLAAPCGPAPALRAKALSSEGSVHWARADYDRATASHRAALELYRRVGDEHGAALSLHNLSCQAREQGDQRAAEALGEEALAAARAVGDPRLILLPLNHLGCVALSLADLPRAADLFDECVSRAREADDRYLASVSLMNLSEAVHRLGDHRRALDLVRESVVLARGLDHKVAIAHSLEGAAGPTAALGHHAAAVRLLGAVDKLREEIGAPAPPHQHEQFYEPVCAVAQARLGEAAFSAAWREGRALPLEDALREALGEPPP